MPKKKVYNNFYFFMLEKKAEYAKKGIKYTMKQISEIVGPAWKELNSEERTKYDNMAKDYKARSNGGTGFSGKLASDGTKILENLKIEEKLIQEKDSHLLRLRTLIGAQLDDAAGFKKMIPAMKFYVMEFNFACKIEETDSFIPIEIGLVEFSIQNGVTKSYHEVIDFGQVPMGYFGHCKIHSDDYHKLFLNSDVDKEDDYCKIWSDIMKFLSPKGRQLPPIFTCHENFEVRQTSGCLRWLAIRADKEQVYEKIEFFSLAYLLYELRSAASSSIPLSVSIDLLTGSAFDYTVGLNCDFHEELDSLYCALGLAKRKCFLLLDAVCKLFDISVTDDHVPNRSAPDFEYNIYVDDPLKQSKRCALRHVRIGNNVTSKQSGINYALDEISDVKEEKDNGVDPPQPVFYRGIGRGVFPKSIVLDGSVMPSKSVEPPKLVAQYNSAEPSKPISTPKPVASNYSAKPSKPISSPKPVASNYSAEPSKPISSPKPAASNNSTASPRFVVPNNSGMSPRYSAPNNSTAPVRFVVPHSSAVSARCIAPNNSAVSARIITPNNSAVSLRYNAPNNSAASLRFAAPNNSVVSSRPIAPNNSVVPSRPVAANNSNKSVISSMPVRSSFADSNPELIQRFARVGIGRGQRITHDWDF